MTTILATIALYFAGKEYSISNHDLADIMKWEASKPCNTDDTHHLECLLQWQDDGNMLTSMIISRIEHDLKQQHMDITLRNDLTVSIHSISDTRGSVAMKNEHGTWLPCPWDKKEMAVFEIEMNELGDVLACIANIKRGTLRRNEVYDLIDNMTVRADCR